MLKRKSSLLQGFASFSRVMFIIIMLLFIVYPLFFSFVTSLKTKNQYIINPIGFNVFELSFSNYLNVISNFNFIQKMLNTGFVVFTSLVVILLLSVPSAFVLNFLPNWRRTLMDIILFSFMFIPDEVLLLPEYTLMARLGLINKYTSVILFFIAQSLPEAIFLLKIYFALVPQSVIDAARIDGASDSHILLFIVVPLSKSPITVVCVNIVIALWNSFLIPMLLLYDDSHKLLIPSLSGLITKHSSAPTFQMAGTCLSMLPLLLFYVIFKKHIFENTIGGAVNAN